MMDTTSGEELRSQRAGCPPGQLLTQSYSGEARWGNPMVVGRANVAEPHNLGRHQRAEPAEPGGSYGNERTLNPTVRKTERQGCDDIAAAMLVHPKVLAARVSTAKPDVYPDCHSVGVEVFRIKQA